MRAPEADPASSDLPQQNIEHESEQTFFVDRSLGSAVVAGALRTAGAHVEVHDDLFAPNVADVVWLAEVGRRGWIVLTKDARIRKRIIERQALKATAVHTFFMGNGCRGGAVMAQAYVSALPSILRAVKSATAPIWMTVHPDGRLTKLPQD